MTSNPIPRIVRVSLTLIALSCGTAFAQPTRDTTAAQDATAPNENSIKLSRVFMSLPTGSTWLSLHIGKNFCIGSPITKTWTEGRVAEPVAPYAATFKTELQQAGFKVVTPGEDNLFESGGAAADYEAAAVISDAQIDGCIDARSFTIADGGVRGSGSMKVDWQIYSPIRKQVVAHISTSGIAKLDHTVPGGAPFLIVQTFAANVRELASNADFRAALSAPKAMTKGFVMPDQQSKIVLPGSLNIPKRQIADATGSVVTILTGSGSGSGFLVSTDGYLLTDAHVVGDEKNVRVRWSDGLETLATVERASQKRDVAILKTNPRDRAPLALRRGPVALGQRVYAIGSPGGRKFESTVSSGVISADRVFDGLRYIQSDTTVSHGSSGGPLLDENGAVIGLTDLGIPNMGPTGEEGPAGLNLFTPIGDAMDFLSLEQK